MDLKATGLDRAEVAAPGQEIMVAFQPSGQPADALSGEESVLYTEKNANQALALQIEGPDPEALSSMVGDKDIDSLRALGGTAGLLRSLGVDASVGLVSPQHDAPDTTAYVSAASGGPLEPIELRRTKSRNAELAKGLADEQGGDDLAWLAEFEADRKTHADRVGRYGINILPPTKSRSFLGLVWDALHDKMLILLIVAAIVSLAIGIYQDVRVTKDPVEDSQDVHWVEGFAIIVAIAVVTLVASINDYQKEKQFRKLNAKKNNRRVRVTRGGQERLVSTNCILVGDILHIEPGDILCADGVVIASSNLKCDESSVTGESDAIKKACLEDTERAAAEHKSRRQLRRAELRSKRNEQRAFALRLKDNMADEIEPAEFHEESGAEADDSTDGEDAENREPTGEFLLGSAHEKALSTLPQQEHLEQQQPLVTSLAAAAAKERRAKAHVGKRGDPFLISGSRVLEGMGRCVVVAVGEKSFYGRIVMSLRFNNDGTPLQAKLDGLANLIAKLGCAAGLLMLLVLIIKYAVQLGRNETSRDATSVADSIVRIIISAVTVIVVAVPEGLPLAVTLALAVATTRMLKDNCLVRLLESCETMGNATTICSDKTGTLTQNRMTVVAGCLGDQYQFSSYPPGTSEMQRRKARQPPADGLVTDMTGRAVPPAKAIVPTLLETEARRQRRLRDRRHRHRQRRMGRVAGASGYSSSSALTPISDTSPSFSGLSDLSDYSEDDNDDGLIIPTAELGEEAPLAVMNLCYDAIAVNSTAFIPATDQLALADADPIDAGLLGNSDAVVRNKQVSVWHRLLRLLRVRKGQQSSNGLHEESRGEFSGASSSADKFMGSKTETALLSWSETLGAANYAQLRDKDVDKHVHMWPFSSERKSMSTLVRIRRREDGKMVWRLYVKGAPEVVIQSCRWIVDVDGAFQMQDHEEILNKHHELPLVAGGIDIASAANAGDGDGDGEDSPGALRINVPQINLDHGSEDEADGNDNGSDDKIQTVTCTPYLLSAHYTSSRNAGSETTDVAEDSLLAASFPPGFAHNPAIPVLPLDEGTLHDLRHTISDYASRALRTIGMAYRDFETFDEGCLAQLESDVEWRETAGLVCLGIFAIEDPLREGVTDAVRRCQNAGIIVRMVTGDNPLTARAIATQCGIFTPGMGGIILEGAKFRRLSPEQMDFIVPRLQVLARSSPEDKRMLVEWLRTHGEVVAVTGDGTNDGPALKAANVGFSMGIAGTEVAKEASSIVLMDDNFKSIVRACMWGRTVNDAVKKFLQFQITVNVTAVLIAFVSSVADKQEQSVFTAVQLLWINLIMDTFAALALATDPPSEDLLDRYPEKPDAPLITFTMWKNIIGQAVFQVVVCFLTLYAADDIFHLHTVQSSYDMLVLRTLVFNTFAWMQIFNEFNCRVLHNEVNCFKGMQKNWFFLGIVLISVVGQIIIVQWGGVAFQTTGLSGKYWAFSIVAGFISLPVGLVLRLIPDQLVWWILPFVPQDIYREPPSLEWQPPALSVRNRLVGNDEAKPGYGGNSGNDRSSTDEADAAALNEGLRSSVARLGAGISRRMAQSPLTRGLGAHSPDHSRQNQHARRTRTRSQTASSGAVLSSQPLRVDTSADRLVAQPAVDPPTLSKRQDKRRKRSGSGETKPKSVIAAAMVPSLVASSIGIGMSTSAMPPNKMTIEELVDQELEKQTSTAAEPTADQ
ncbi:plasma membrane calcium [Coemansia sp. RSA 2320]|nr:plasma membrane calcium [Coemansia sp. RSA 2320]